MRTLATSSSADSSVAVAVADDDEDEDDEMLLNTTARIIASSGPRKEILSASSARADCAGCVMPRTGTAAEADEDDCCCCSFLTASFHDFKKGLIEKDDDAVPSDTANSDRIADETRYTNDARTSGEDDAAVSC